MFHFLSLSFEFNRINAILFDVLFCSFKEPLLLRNLPANVKIYQSASTFLSCEDLRTPSHNTAFLSSSDDLAKCQRLLLCPGKAKFSFQQSWTAKIQDDSATSSIWFLFSLFIKRRKSAQQLPNWLELQLLLKRPCTVSGEHPQGDRKDWQGTLLHL